MSLSRSTRPFTKEDAIAVAKQIKTDAGGTLYQYLQDKRVPIEEWRQGVETEYKEHGSSLGQDTNVINDNYELAARIAFAHIKEHPRYYQALFRMEQALEEAELLPPVVYNWIL